MMPLFALALMLSSTAIPQTTAQEPPRANPPKMRRVSGQVLISTEMPALYATVQGKHRPIARQEPGERVYYLGPQAGLPLPQESVPEVRSDQNNAVSLWRYAAEVTAFAETYLAVLFRRTDAASLFSPHNAVRELPRVRQRKERGDHAEASFRFD
jgi:hypothetical protein